jgi:hypothetical protein
MLIRLERAQTSNSTGRGQVLRENVFMIKNEKGKESRDGIAKREAIYPLLPNGVIARYPTMFSSYSESITKADTKQKK